MKITKIVLIAFILGLTSCEDFFVPDYRNSVIGDYEGIKIYTDWNNTTRSWVKDTTEIMITLSKSKSDTVIEVDFEPKFTNTNFAFEYKDNEFYNYDSSPAYLSIKNDSLSFSYSSGNAPWSIGCKAIKVN